MKQYLDEKGIPYKDYGTFTEESCNYATYGHLLAEGIERGEVYPGIAMCGSGEGISMTLNKHQSIRAGLAWIPEIAHNDMARRIMDEYLNTDFEGGRHQQRIDAIPVKK